MNTPRSIAAWAICLTAGGCSMYHAGIQAVIVEPLQYCMHTEYHFSLFRDHKAANNAWTQVVASCPTPLSWDYEMGFKKGFCDYLLEGGSGLPPGLPPRRYWKAKYQTPEGHIAVEEWLAGFRHGASVAQTSGLRQVVVVPTSVPFPLNSDWRTPSYGDGFERGSGAGQSGAGPLGAVEVEVLPGPEGGSFGTDLPPTAPPPLAVPPGS